VLSFLFFKNLIFKLNSNKEREDGIMADVAKIKKRGWLSTGDVMKLTGLSQQTVIRRFDKGELKGFKVPGSKFRRIPVKDFLKFVRDYNLPIDKVDKALWEDEEKGKEKQNDLIKEALPKGILILAVDNSDKTLTTGDTIEAKDWVPTSGNLVNVLLRIELLHFLKNPEH